MLFFPLVSIYIPSDKELERFEDSKFLPAYLLLGLFCMETIRFCCSSGYNRARHRRQYEYKTLSTLKDLDDRLINNRTEQVRIKQ